MYGLEAPTVNAPLDGFGGVRYAPDALLISSDLIFRMLTIRLRRFGKRSRPTYRFVVMEKRRDPQGRAVEFLGSYDPHTNPPTVNLKRERVTHWLGVGAQPSESVHNIFVDAGLKDGPKVVVAKAKAKPAAAVEPAVVPSPPAPPAA